MRSLLRCALWLALAAASLSAQGPGTLRGRVLDPSGAAIPRTTLTATGSNSVVRTTETDDRGNYTLAGLEAGEYAVRATAAGFSLFENRLNVADGRVTTLDIHMSLALNLQEVQVSETEQAQVAVDPAQNASQIVVENKSLDMLADNPDDLEADLLALAGPTVGPSGGQIFIDGFSNGDLPTKQSIREVRINNNPFSAEYDRPGFGRVEVVTRPGTQRLHGSAGFNFADSALNARNPYALVKPPSQMRQFDLSVTGPLSKTASFTLDASRQSQDSTALINAEVPDSSLVPQLVNQIVPTPNTRRTVAPRIDWAITPNVTFTARYSNFHPTSENSGVGGFTLTSRGTTSVSTHQSGQFTLSVLHGMSYVNETRFQYHHSGTDSWGDSDTPGLVVSGSFSNGGAPFALNYADEGSYEFQNNSSYSRGSHYLKFGARIRAVQLGNYSTTNYNGTFTFTSLSAYLLTVQGLAQGLGMTQIQAMGGGPFQYSVTEGTPLTHVNQIDASPYVQDDWKVKPNLTLSLGLRYEIQTNISDRRDWAPRLALAWGIGRAQGRSSAPKTVLRLGFGIFYDRIDDSLTLQALRQNGITQQFFVIPDPSSYPMAPSTSGAPQSIQLLSHSLVSPRSMQSAVAVERQLPKRINLSVTYTNTRGVHQLQEHDINAPLGGVFPFGDPNPRFLYESGALFKQSQLTVNVNARVNTRFSLFSYYSYGHAYSNSDGVGSFPADNYNLAAEWSRAGFDIRHRSQIGGSVTVPWGIQIAPSITMSSAPPLNIVTGTDLNGDTLLTDRPAFATVPADPAQGVVATPWGVFNLDPVHNPGAGTAIIPRNFGDAYGRWDISGRISRTWSFGERTGTNNNGARRYGLTAGLQGRNWLNHVNPGPPVGNLSSPFFGQSLNLQSGQSTTANRRLELNLRFSF